MGWPYCCGLGSYPNGAEAGMTGWGVAPYLSAANGAAAGAPTGTLEYMCGGEAAGVRAGDMVGDCHALGDPLAALEETGAEKSMSGESAPAVPLVLVPFPASASPSASLALRASSSLSESAMASWSSSSSLLAEEMFASAALRSLATSSASSLLRPYWVRSAVAGSASSSPPWPSRPWPRRLELSDLTRRRMPWRSRCEVRFWA
mmetsp:Transcript_23481/g.74847  ORF Transcript_23481/g.74847 Transcript_23481/m.74847 type:complete len:204 (-) Transcript_23481:116-727(-)